MGLVAQMVKNLPAVQETGVQPWAGKIPWSRDWLPTPVFLPGEFHGQRSLEAYSPWGHKKLDMTEQPSMHSCTGAWSSGEKIGLVIVCCWHTDCQLSFDSRLNDLWMKICVQMAVRYFQGCTGECAEWVCFVQDLVHQCKEKAQKSS